MNKKQSNQQLLLLYLQNILSFGDISVSLLIIELIKLLSILLSSILYLFEPITFLFLLLF